MGAERPQYTVGWLCRCVWMLHVAQHAMVVPMRCIDARINESGSDTLTAKDRALAHLFFCDRLSSIWLGVFEWCCTCRIASK